MAYIGMLEIFVGIVIFSVGWWLKHRDAVLFNWPVLGMAPQFAANVHQFHEWSTKIVTISKGTFFFKGPLLTKMDMLCTVDPINVKHIMNTHFSNYPKGPEFNEIFQVFGDGIFNADFDLWRYQRKTATSVTKQDQFRKVLMKTVSAKVEEKLLPVVEHVCDNGIIVDLQDLAHRFTFDTLLKMISGHDPQHLNKKFTQVEFFTALEYVEEALFYRVFRPKMVWKLEKWLGFGQERRMKIGWEIADRTVAELIGRKKEQLSKEEDEEVRFDLLTKLLKEKEIQTYKFLRDSLFSFMFPRENSLGWFFWLVSKNPQVKHKIREELNSILPLPTREVKFLELGKLNKLVYLHAAICETLRLYPTVMYERKEAVEPDVLPSKHYVDKGMTIFIPVYVMGRMRSLWGEDCEEFKPERWISDEGKLIQHSPYKFMSFNAGPRTCIGKEMAFIQMKAMAAFIIHNYDYQVMQDRPAVPNYASIILHMKHGCPVKLYRRFTS